MERGGWSRAGVGGAVGQRTPMRVRQAGWLAQSRLRLQVGVFSRQRQQGGTLTRI
jgi:hypothetical protein